MKNMEFGNNTRISIDDSLKSVDLVDMVIFKLEQLERKAPSNCCIKVKILPFLEKIQMELTIHFYMGPIKVISIEESATEAINKAFNQTEKELERWKSIRFLKTSIPKAG